ncbi:Peptidyl-prolyl cis-trans isomerase [Bacillus thermotolerans]|uniref:Peptidyl-prolyl cis-trans isomerase n=2 Tax=Bacillus thermotolerans TaxID=1221996 RepID=A0A0F5I903_BACTR|nr:Peptidyl-prolyl cis-trans isomerase [Bacillus thermotolerans]KKB41928.1 Peptidyl-prolyl cis-trans isomerase [Bacillus thermotolerans]
MYRLFTVGIGILLLLLAGCSKGEESQQQSSSLPALEEGGWEQQEGEKEMSYPQFTAEVAANEQLVEMQTNKGTIKIKLFPEQAPKTVENFVTHSKNGYYDGLIFHRVIPDFMIQGGDPNGTGTGGESIYGGAFEDEFSRELFNFRGALSMANAGPNTNGSQFFIVQNSNMDPGFRGQLEQAGYPQEVIEHYVENGGTPWLDFRHTVFGQVVEGMDVVDEIAKTPTGPQDKPKEDVVIEKITVVE